MKISSINLKFLAAAIQALLKPATGVAALALLGVAACANAQNLNGTLNAAFYGSPRYIQTVNTQFGNSTGNDGTGGSELDAVYIQTNNGNLYLFIAGTSENSGNHMNIFIAGSGNATGQSVFNPPNTGSMHNMLGSSFYPPFKATFALDINDYAGTLYTEEYNLVAVTGGYVGALGNSGTGIYAGSDGGVTTIYGNNNLVSTMGAATQALSGSNVGAAVTTGFELVIPLSAIGYAGGGVNAIDVLVDINGGGDGYLSNQFLPGLQPIPYGNIGNPPVFNFGNTPTCTVVNSVDMSALAFYGLWDPSQTVHISGLGGTPVTNVATGPYIYYVTNTIPQLGQLIHYKWYYDATAGGQVYENPAPPTYGQYRDRFFTVPNVAGTNLPTVFFSDNTTNDLISAPGGINVTYTVDMTGATDFISGTVFAPGDYVYVNGITGAFLNWTAIDLNNQRLFQFSGNIYTNTFLMPQGTPIRTLYKYGFAYAGQTNSVDNSAGQGTNLLRYIRSSVTGGYAFPTDTFGSSQNEPSFGQLAVGTASGGFVPLSWLGSQAVQLQTRSSLTSGTWTTVAGTDGSVWTSFVNSTNGSVSVTNWPASTGSTFFRLLQQP